MHTKLITTAIATTLAGSLFLAPLAHAVEYTQVQADKSTVQFSYQQMGVKMDGRFRKFSSQLSFDPAKPAAARVSFEVELASVDTGSPEADQEVAGKPWFNSAAFPVARFVSSSVKPLGNNRYEVAGKLTIKGKTQDLTFPASFAAPGNNDKGGVFEGGFTLRRADFSIGEGSWAKFDIVANDIGLKFRIAVQGK
ncbi:YceI family protein [Dechloromonas sp. ZY10]|uniref:YceI family protein n=1 Tax=Dechloromonas aquae TaxID=2664436 RepID=UPI0035277A27